MRSSDRRELYVTNTRLELGLEAVDAEDLSMVSALFSEGTIAAEVEGGVLREEVLDLRVEISAGACCWDGRRGNHGGQLIQDEEMV